MKIKSSFFKKNLCKATIPIMLLLIQCDQIPDYIPEYEVAAKWADMTLFVTKNTPANSPTFASRCLGYLGLAQYESVVHGDENHQSFSPF